MSCNRLPISDRNLREMCERTLFANAFLRKESNVTMFGLTLTAKRPSVPKIMATIVAQ